MARITTATKGRASPVCLITAFLGWALIVLTLYLSSRKPGDWMDTLRIAVIPSVENLPVLLLTEGEDTVVNGASVELVRVSDSDVGRELLLAGIVDVFVDRGAENARIIANTAVPRECTCCSAPPRRRPVAWWQGNLSTVTMEDCTKADYRSRDGVAVKSTDLRLVAWCTLPELQPVEIDRQQGTSLNSVNHWGTGQQWGLFTVSERLMKSRPDIVRALSKKIADTHADIGSGKIHWRNYLLREGLWEQVSLDRPTS